MGILIYDRVFNVTRYETGRTTEILCHTCGLQWTITPGYAKRICPRGCNVPADDLEEWIEDTDDRLIPKGV